MPLHAFDGPLRPVRPLLLGLLMLAIPYAGAAQSPEGAVPSASRGSLRVDDVLRNRLEAARTVSAAQVQRRLLRSADALQAVYLERGYRPMWSSPSGALLPMADSLVAVIQGAASHGLEPEDYALSRLEQLRGQVGSGDLPATVDLDLLLTDAFLTYGSDLLMGRVDPSRVDPEWIAIRRTGDLPAALARATSGAGVRAVLEGELAPQQPEYARLRQALATLERARSTDPWSPVGPGPSLKEGDEDIRVGVLRQRLILSTDPGERRAATEESGDPNRFDPSLGRAVRSFQVRHGLEADGVVGSGTLAALDVPLGERMRQLRVNLERWRWLPTDLGRRHIRVNIAAFETEVWNDGEVALHLRSIVGRQYRTTPSFTGSMRYLVLAPYWHVPPGIAALDKLPDIRRDPGIIARQHFTLLDAATHRPVDPASVDWSAVDGPTFNSRYRLRQDPGPWNALGEAKFMFPNSHSVYLHDTPNRELFDRTRRDFSSGCIRVENALELARYLLSNEPGWTLERIQDEVSKGVERTIPLSEPVPVHLLYWTAFVEEDGRVHFRPDLYERDGRVLAALGAAEDGS